MNTAKAAEMEVVFAKHAGHIFECHHYGSGQLWLVCKTCGYTVFTFDEPEEPNEK